LVIPQQNDSKIVQLSQQKATLRQK